MQSQTIITYIAIMLITAAMGGCTHNDGDIGPLFGKRKLESIVVDGVKDTNYEDDMFWSFQSTTIGMTRVIDATQTEQTYGSWSINKEKNELTLHFPDDKFPPLPQSGLPRTSMLKIIKMSGNELILQYDRTDGESSLTYYLKKW